MERIYRLIGLSLLALLIAVLAGCSRRPSGEPSPVPATIAPTEAPIAASASDTPTSVLSATVASTAPAAAAVVSATLPPAAAPITEADVDSSMDLVRRFLAGLSQGEFRDVYGSLLTTAGQKQLADLVLGRLALSNPHISYFEVLGAEPAGDRVAVDVMWEETFEGQGKVGSQRAQVLLARQDGAFLIDDIVLEDYQPAATPVPPPLPKAEALTTPAATGQEMRFRASGFQSGETVMAWLELPDGKLLPPSFETADDAGALEKVYPADVTQGLEAGRWIWWAQALRDSTRNTGITFEVQAAPTPEPTPTTAPTRPRPTPTRVQAAQPPAATAPPVAVQPTATPQPSSSYPAPTILWPEPETSRNFGSALVVEFVPVAEELAPDEFYQLVLEAQNSTTGQFYNGGSVIGKGDACSGQYSQACRSITGDERFMDLFHLGGVEGRGTYYVQVVKQSGEQYTPISPPSEPHVVILKPRPDEG